jgi:hypothetical protein
LQARFLRGECRSWDPIQTVGGAVMCGTTNLSDVSGAVMRGTAITDDRTLIGITLSR